MSLDITSHSGTPAPDDLVPSRYALRVGEIDVPVAQLLTEEDNVVPLWRQEKLLAGLPAAHSWRVHAQHDAVVTAPEQFLPALEEACTWVATEASWGGPPTST